MGCCAVSPVLAPRVVPGLLATIVELLCFGVNNVIIILSLSLPLLHVTAASLQHIS